MPLLGLDEPPPYGVIAPDGASPLLLLCEHASPRVPRRLAHLGLPRHERLRHIGWDIGALALAQDLSARLDAALFHTGYSRLVVDCNRPLKAPSLMPEVSEDTPIPGNRALSPEAREERIATLFRPFHAAVARRLDQRAQAGLPSFIAGIHSFTPVFRGEARPWHVGVLHAGDSGSFAPRLLAALRAEPGLVVGENAPYQIDADDYTVPVHGSARSLPALLIEVRQDLIDSAQGVADWGARLSRCLTLALEGTP